MLQAFVDAGVARDNITAEGVGYAEASPEFDSRDRRVRVRRIPAP
ncbi:hypothetical protein JNUCC0626_17390 [Lentzea sp. JNUCC 0626]